MKYLIAVIIIILFLLQIAKAQTWVAQTSGTATGLTSVYFTDVNTGWAVGWLPFPNKVILKTTNGGIGWVSQSIPAATIAPDKVYMINSSTGYISTRDGQILKTSDGGASWFVQLTVSGGDFLCMKFVNSNTGYAAGYPGIIYKTTNAGSNWISQTSGISTFMYDMTFIGTDTGYISSLSGVILRTVNGGATWSQLVIPGASQLSAIAFINASTGIAAGGVIYRTTNSGINWVTVGLTSLIYSMTFTDANTGYYVNSTGGIGKTTNAGMNWFSQTSGTTNALRSVFFVNQTTGYAVGTNGTILYTNDQPLPVELSYFNSMIKYNDVTLKWGTVWELNNSGFEIERTPLNPPERGTLQWVKAGFVPGNGTTNEANDYIFTDKKLQTGKYKYRLKQVDYNGNYEYHSLNEDVTIGTPVNFNVSQNYPNPSNPKSKIDFKIPNDGHVSIKVYDLLGKEVLTISEEYKTAGFYTTELDGSRLSSGIYFYRVTVEGSEGKFSDVKKMVLVK